MITGCFKLLLSPGAIMPMIIFIYMYFLFLLQYPSSLPIHYSFFF